MTDNIAAIVNPIFNDYTSYPGIQIVIATMLFGIEIYCDFAGYSNIAIGSAKVLGIDLMRNFNSPYMAVSVTDFWKRWHISLTSWFRDYLYIPLGGNRKGRFRKYINTIIVFLSSGFWHGASWNFVFWGLINGVFIIIEDFLNSKPKIKGIKSSLNIWTKRIITFLLVDFAWLFFRAPSFMSAINIIKYSVQHSGIRGLFSASWLTMFQNNLMFIVIMSSLAIMLIQGIISERSVDFKDDLLNRKRLFRWAVYIFLIIMIILFGAYGEGYEQTEFIYFQF